jgi:hypothetical protein
MGRKLEEWTAQVLNTELPALPARLEPGQAVPVAIWRGKHYGAVLFLRLWKNGNVDSDCAIAERAADESWDEPWSSGGGGWIQDPLVRSETGWDGDPVVWLGRSGLGFGADDEEYQAPEPVEPRKGLGISQPLIVRVPEGSSEEETRGLVAAARQQEEQALQRRWDRFDVRTVVGAASMPVAAIEVEQAGRSWRAPIDSPCGAFIVGLEQSGPATLRVLDREGQPLADADGVTERPA